MAIGKLLKGVNVPSKDFISSNIDIMRGLAILLVIAVHTSNMTSLMGLNPNAVNHPIVFKKITDILNFGASGVGLFFFISGFLIYMLYWKNINYKSYAVRRASRIMPLWAFWLAFSTVIATLGIRWWFHYEEHGRTVTNFLYGEGYNLLDAQNIIPILAYFVFLGFLNPTNYNWVVPGGWSIQTEIYHYTLFPFMRKAGMTFSLCVLFIIQILFILFTFGKQPSPELAILSAYVVGPIFFVLGMLTSQAFKFIQTKEELFKVKIIDWILMVSILVVSCFIKINPNSSINTPKTITVIVVSIIASFVIYKLNIIKKLTSSVGKYSYGMYFSHFLIMPLIAYPIVNYLFIEANNEKINTSVAILSLIPIFLISVLGSYLVALVTYNMLEKHVINWSKKF